MFFVAVFAATALSRKPLFIVPGILSSNLQMSTSGKPKHWYCPRGRNISVFGNILNFVPPKLNCALEYASLRYDAASDTIVDGENVDIRPFDFGGLSGIDSLIKLPLGLKFGPRLSEYISFAKGYGYTEGKDMFGVPNDWRLGVFQKDEFWAELRNLIEKAVENNKEKAVIHSHSLGCLITQRFLTEFVSDEWKEKYIDNVVYIGPAFAGSSHALSTLIDSKFHGIKSEGLTKFIQHMSSVYQLLPNLELNGDVPIILKPSETYKISEIGDYLIANNNLTEQEKMILNKSIKISHQMQKENNVRTLIIYNSAIPTRFAVDMRTSKTTFIREKGDGVVLSDGINKICEKWNMKKELDCVDVQEMALSHNKLIKNPLSLNIIMKWSLDEESKSQKYHEL